MIAPGAGFVVALENLFPPIPSEIILPLAGVTASRGGFTLLEAIFWTTAGPPPDRCWGRTCSTSWAGGSAGTGPVRSSAGFPSSPSKTLTRWRRGLPGTAARRSSSAGMVPLFRSLVSIPAGIDRMPLLPFLALTLAGSLVWNSVLVLAGYFLGESWPLVEQYAGVLQGVVIAATAPLVTVVVVRKVRKARSKVSA